MSSTGLDHCSDVIPYGGVEEPDRSVHLPNDHRLNVLGVREAFDAADTVLLPGGLEVRVPTIPGLALPKIIVWYDRRFLNKRDATDLDEIINWYSDGLPDGHIFVQSSPGLPGPPTIDATSHLLPVQGRPGPDAR